LPPPPVQPGVAPGGPLPPSAASAIPGVAPAIQPPPIPPANPPPGTPSAVVQPPGTAPPPRALAVTPQPPGTPAPLHQFSIQPRRPGGFQFQKLAPLPTGEDVLLVTGGAIINVNSSTDRTELLDIAADRVVVWMRGNVQDAFDN